MNIRTTYRLGGPVGLIYALRLAWLRHRLSQVARFRDRERDLHRQVMHQLDVELKALVDAQQRTHTAAADFWRQIERPTHAQGAQ